MLSAKMAAILFRERWVYLRGFSSEVKEKKQHMSIHLDSSLVVECYFNVFFWDFEFIWSYPKASTFQKPKPSVKCIIHVLPALFTFVFTCMVCDFIVFSENVWSSFTSLCSFFRWVWITLIRKCKVKHTKKQRPSIDWCGHACIYSVYNFA